MCGIMEGAIDDIHANESAEDVFGRGGGEEATTCRNRTSQSGQVDDDDDICYPWVNPHLLVGIIFLYLLVVTVNAGIIVYERVVADIYRTLVNKMVAVMSLYNICLTTWAIIVFVLRSAFDVNLGTVLCGAHLFVLVILILQEFLILIEINLLCLFHLRKLRIFSMNEEFGTKLSVFVNFVLSSFFSSVICVLLGGKEFFFYQICIGGCWSKKKESLFPFQGHVISICHVPAGKDRYLGKGELILFGFIAAAILQNLFLECGVLMQRKKMVSPQNNVQMQQMEGGRRNDENDGSHLQQESGMVEDAYSITDILQYRIWTSLLPNAW